VVELNVQEEHIHLVLRMVPLEDSDNRSDNRLVESIERPDVDFAVAPI
jgi:hypothetical protein